MTDKPKALQLAQGWFDLDLYDGAAGFGRQQWIEQIAKRAVIKTAMKENDIDLLGKLIPGLIKAPLANWAFKYGNTTPAIEDLDFATGPVVPLGFSDLDRLQGLRELIPPVGIDGIDEWRPKWGLKNEELLRQFGHLKVDLNVRDKDIITGFRRWLTFYRAAIRFPSPKKLYRKDINAEAADWHAVRMLPYFDLKAWAKWSRNRLTEPDQITLLYPDDPTGPTRDKLRKLPKKVARIITISNAMALSKAVSN